MPWKLVVRARALAALFAAGLLATACDGGQRPPDAQAVVSVSSAELAVRFEVAEGKPPTVSVLGFRASTIAPDALPDVLGLVDPLSAAAPDQGCALRDVDQATSALGARGSSIDLEELSGVGVGFGPGDPLVRPFPRLFPDVAGVVGGVVAEAAPQPLELLPDRLSVYGAGSELPLAELTVPGLPRLLAVNGAAPAGGMRVDAAEGLSLSLGGAAGSLVELRPYGSTVAVTCAVPGNASTESVVTVPHALLVHLPHSRAGSWGVPVSIEVARRIRAREPIAPMGARVSVEIRSALAAELRP
jgi:hypothetical protein